MDQYAIAGYRLLTVYHLSRAEASAQPLLSIYESNVDLYDRWKTPFIIFVNPITSVMGLTNVPKPMNIDDLLAKLARGQQHLRDPAVWQKRGDELFPDTAFTVAVYNGQVKITGLNPEQQRLLQQDIAKLIDL